MAKLKLSLKEWDELSQKNKLNPETGEKATKVTKIKEKVKAYGKKKIETVSKKVKKQLPKLVSSAPLGAVSGIKTALSIGKSYRAKDYTSHVTKSTATMKGTRGEYSRSGLRSEFTSRGPVNEDRMPILDEHWSTHTEARGSLIIGKPISKGSLTTKSRISPTLPEMAPLLGNVIMPVGIRKAKRRK